MNQDLFIQRTNQIRELKSSLMLGLDDVQEWVLNTESSLNYISPFQIQTETGLSYRKATAILLAGTLTGAFQIHWNYISPHSGKITDSYHSLSACKQKSFCNTSSQEYEGDLSKNIIVNFSLHPEIKNSSLQNTENSLLEEPQLTAIELLHIPEFKEFFGNETISTNEKIITSSVTILFSSIQGSTQLYESMGDIAAFELIKEHFQLLKEAIQNNNGIIVKTIGDSVMASFVNITSAIHAMFKIVEKFKIFNMPRTFSNQINLKLVIHEGPALLVNLNDRLDYFGATVNKASKIHLVANQEEMCMLEEIFQREEIKELLKIYGVRRVKRSKQVLKGLSENHSIIKIPTQP